MAAAFTFKVRTRGTTEFLNFTSAELRRAWRPAGFRLAQRFFAFHTRKKLRGGGERNIRATRRGWLSRGRPGNPRFRDVSQQGNKTTLEMDFRGAVAITHEKGERQRAEAGRYFVLPMPAARTTRGKLKAGAKRALERSRALIREGLQRRDLRTKRERQGVLFPIRSGGRIFLAQRVGRQLRLLFHLQKTLTYRERLDYFETWNEYRPQALDVYRKEVRRIIGGIRAGRVR